jgi:hypothetical protein
LASTSAAIVLPVPRWRPTSEGKDGLKAKLGRSPDRADAVVVPFYTYAAGGREPGDYGVTT